MSGNFSTVLITLGSLACFGAFGWFLESAAEQSAHDDSAPEDTVQQQRAHTYMAAVVVTMCAFIAQIV